MLLRAIVLPNDLKDALPRALQLENSSTHTRVLAKPPEVRRKEKMVKTKLDATTQNSIGLINFRLK
jgi:hypothetical protein